MNPQFPLYIVSKGRFDTRLTSKALEEMGVPYSIIVEESEYTKYCAVIDKAKVLVLDPAYQRNYDAFDNDSVKSKGSGPARNFAWDHSASRGYAWHWCVDDNIRCFLRLNNNAKIRVSDGTIFKCMEDFVLRYKNTGLAGPNYRGFVPQNFERPPYNLNTRVYSCILIRNDIGFQWRGRYNEDTDLSIRAMKSGWCTVLFNAFLQQKEVTMTMKGGNTDELYANGTLEKSRMIVAMHPDVCRLGLKYGRMHHYADYKLFKRLRLVRNDDAKASNNVNEYGMRLVKV